MDEGIEFANVSPTSKNELYQFRSFHTSTNARNGGEKGDSRSAHKLMETFHGQGLPVAQTTNFEGRKGTWDDRRRRELENYITNYIIINNII